MVLVLTRAELTQLLTMEDCIAALERAHVEFSRRQVVMPVRLRVVYPERQGSMAIMPAVLKETDAMGIKVQCNYPPNAARGLPLIMGLVILYDPATGAPQVIMDSAYVTAVRTAAASAMATKHLARADARVLAILGTGVQGRAHLWAVKTVRPIERVLAWSHTRASAEAYQAEMEARHGLPVALCATPEEAVRAADIVCTTSLAKAPIVAGAWLRPGTHINAVGAHTLDAREVDSDTIARARVYVDALDAVPQESGDIMLPVQEGRITLDHVVGEIGEVIAGSKPGRQTRDEVTFYKSHGIGIQDVATAHMVYQKALRLGRGTWLDI